MRFEWIEEVLKDIQESCDQNELHKTSAELSNAISVIRSEEGAQDSNKLGHFSSQENFYLRTSGRVD